jgi:hypothetical protein
MRGHARFSAEVLDAVQQIIATGVYSWSGAPLTLRAAAWVKSSRFRAACLLAAALIRATCTLEDVPALVQQSLPRLRLAVRAG